MKVKRSFIVGDEWLYYKLYCGAKTSDNILTEIISPVATMFLRKGYIDKWFFIRYTDPDYHLRVRFHLIKNENIFIVINSLYKKLYPYSQNGLIWKITIDTYNREIERYGSDLIHLIEDLFFIDCSSIIKIIPLLKGVHGERIRWLLAIFLIDRTLNDFEINLTKKYILLYKLKTGFDFEFGIDKRLRSQLKDKYRKESKSIYQFMTDPNQTGNFKGIINKRSEFNKLVFEGITKIKDEKGIEKSINDLLMSLIHMQNNRLFRSKQRLHELVIYDFLFHFYRSELAKKNIKIKDPEVQYHLWENE